MSDYIRREDAVMQLSHNKSRGDDEWELAVASDMEIIWKPDDFCSYSERREE